MSDRSKTIVRPNNSFEFVTIAAARARQLLQGCMPKVEGSPKPARRALQEVVAGQVDKVDADAHETSVAPANGVHRPRSQRRHRRLQGGRGRAAAAEARTPRPGGDDADRPALRRSAHVRGHHARARDHVPVRAGHECGDRAHCARLRHEPAARRARDGEHHRKIRERHRRRFPVGALSGEHVRPCCWRRP